MPHSYEIEIECLLGGKDAADSLRAKMKEKELRRALEGILRNG